MHLYIVLAALVATWVSIRPADGYGLQHYGDCEDLSPHCPALCAACEEAESWPETSHESFEVGEKAKRNKTTHFRRPKRMAIKPQKPQRGWIPGPAKRPEWLPSWIPWAYKPQAPQPGGQGGHQQHDDKCEDLVHGSRQLIEAFCPKSCGRCGKSSNPIAAAKVYITSQCSAAHKADGPVGFAISEGPQQI